MKKRSKIIISLLGAVAVCALGTTLYMRTTEMKLLTNNGDTKLTKGVNKNYIEKLYKNKEIVLDEHGESWVYTYDEMGVEIDWTEEQLSNIDKSFKIDLDTLDLKFKTNNTFTNTLNNLNNNRRDSEYAEFSFENGIFEIKEEIVGDKLDIERLNSDLAKKITKSGAQIYLSDYYIPFDNTKPSSAEFREELDRYNNFRISYTNGFSILPEDITEYLLLVDNKIVFNIDTESSAVKDMDKLIDVNLADYDTVGGDWKFTTHDGREIVVSGGTWGDYFDSAEESKYIVEQIKTLTAENNREPIKNQDYADEVPNRYVEVSLDEQHLWFYDNGELVADSPIVTGLKGRMDTPEGVYFISEMIDGKYLRGANYVTWVNKWMRITNRGHGLHDAYWRSSKEFGGNTYKWDGSHGCVNLPKSFAYELYDLLNTKDCVVIY